MRAVPGLGVERVVSGGQTGVDRAALDVALELGLPAGGWCPKGRRAEDGCIPDRYPLHETPSGDYPQRTEWNVRDSDGTLILYRAPLKGGSALTRRLAARLGRPCLALDLTKGRGHDALLQFVVGNRIRVLNVAGPRESEAPGIHEEARALLREALGRG